MLKPSDFMPKSFDSLDLRRRIGSPGVMLRFGRVEDDEPRLEGASEESPGVIARSDRRIEEDEPRRDRGPTGEYESGELVVDGIADMRRLPNGSERDRSRGVMAGEG